MKAKTNSYKLIVIHNIKLHMASIALQKPFANQLILYIDSL